MPISFQTLGCAAHLVTESGRSIGTGFCVTIPSTVPNTDPYGYLVTASHNVHGMTSVLVEIPNSLGRGEMYDAIPVSDWQYPLSGVDIAVALLDDPGEKNYFGFPLSYFMPLGDIILPQLGAQIYYVGIFTPVRRAVARSGTIAALDQKGLSTYLDDPDAGLEYIDFPVHLVDCRSYNGFSGSLCFVQLSYPGLREAPLPDDLPDTEGVTVPLGRMVYNAIPCGMFIAHFSDEGQIIKNPDGAVSRYGMGMMLRGNEIRAALTTEMLLKYRRDADEQRRVDLLA